MDNSRPHASEFRPKEEREQFHGLSPAEVEHNRERFGSNIITPASRTPLWKIFIRKFSDPLIMILIIAGMLSVGISFYEFYGLGHPFSVFFEPIGIFAAIILATGLAFLFETKAEKEFQLSDLEKNIIISHMWPLNFFHFPRSREAVLVCLADKICAFGEGVLKRNYVRMQRNRKQP